MNQLMFKLNALLLLMALAGQAGSQTVTDAYRYAQWIPSGTARSAGVAMSMSALGADFTTLSMNPAGLAMFRRSEFVMTPGMYFDKTTARLSGEGNQSYDDNRSRLILNNIGVVFHTEPNETWTTFNVGIGYNRMNEFTQNFYYQGKSKGSIVQRFSELADGLSREQLDGFEADPAYIAGAIYDFNQDKKWENDYQGFESRSLEKEQVGSIKGSISEIALGMAGNYKEKLMLGLTLGVPLLNFESNKTYTETNTSDTIPLFGSLKWDEYLNTTAIGFNMRLGMIYRFNQAVRLGMAFHTPTWYAMTDDYNNRIEYTYLEQGQPNTLSGESPDGNFDYGYSSPWRFVGSLGFVIQKNGFLTAEAEWLDYGASSFNLTKNDNSSATRTYENELNRQITRDLTSSWNFRFGGEAAIDMFRVRAGIGLYGAGLQGDSGNNKQYSLGMGIREESFYLDMAYVLSVDESTYFPYQAETAPLQTVNLKDRRSRVILTAGFRF